MASKRIVVVGASAGGVRALQKLASLLPADFSAPILAVQHIGAHPSILPDLLRSAGPLPAAHAQDGDEIRAGRILVAPPDRHMVVEDAIVRLVRGPKEHHARPAIDPLFRSAAVTWGPATTGVLLTGLLNDGTPGLQAIHNCGGTTIVQDPAEALAPAMPMSALRAVKVDYQVPVAAMGELLQRLAAGKPGAARGEAPAQITHENDIAFGEGDFMEHLEAIAKPSTFVCPDCDGALWEIRDSQPRRFRCHTGHAYTLNSLYNTHSQTTDESLWSALRALQEKEILLKSIAAGYRGERDEKEAARIDEEAEDIARHAAALRKLIESVPAPPP
jgi:two-component system, chemotaxis family, protein-glutamate methylesterase/glutaminase